MKSSIRTRFSIGMIFLFLIILVLSVFSGYLLNKLSTKTSAILKENYLSVVYAREMSEGIMNINQEIISCYLFERNTDSLKISAELGLIEKSLQAEKNNITEPGEDELVSGIDAGFTEYRKSVFVLMKSTISADEVLSLQNISGILNQQLILLSQMNGKALEVKTDDAKLSSKKALTQMTILASLCFLIGMSFTVSFASYFSQRFFLLYSGIKEIVSSDYDRKLFFEGNDEFYEISLVFNEMAEKLQKNKQKMSVPLQNDLGKEISFDDIQELKMALFRIKALEEQTAGLISRLEKK